MQVAQLCNEPFSIVHMIAFLTSIYSHLKSSSSSHNLSRIITTIKINCNYGGSQCRSLSMCDREREGDTLAKCIGFARTAATMAAAIATMVVVCKRLGNYSQALGENRIECYRHSHHHHHHHHHRRTPDVEVSCWNCSELVYFSAGRERRANRQWHYNFMYIGFINAKNDDNNTIPTHTHTHSLSHKYT